MARRLSKADYLFGVTSNLVTRLRLDFDSGGSFAVGKTCCMLPTRCSKQCKTFGAKKEVKNPLETFRRKVRLEFTQ